MVDNGVLEGVPNGVVRKAGGVIGSGEGLRETGVVEACSVGTVFRGETDVDLAGRELCDPEIDDG